MELTRRSFFARSAGMLGVAGAALALFDARAGAGARAACAALAAAAATAAR